MNLSGKLTTDTKLQAYNYGPPPCYVTQQNQAND